ncbi:TPA: hypothetical protein ACICCA_004063 [Escherichia coli]
MNDSYYFRTSDPDYIRHAPSMLEILSKAFPTIITQQESEYELQRLNHLLNKLKGSNRCYNIIAQKLRQCRNGSPCNSLICPHCQRERILAQLAIFRAGKASKDPEKRRASAWRFNPLLPVCDESARGKLNLVDLDTGESVSFRALLQGNGKAPGHAIDVEKRQTALKQTEKDFLAKVGRGRMSIQFVKELRSREPDHYYRAGIRSLNHLYNGRIEGQYVTYDHHYRLTFGGRYYDQAFQNLPNEFKAKFRTGLLNYDIEACNLACLNHLFRQYDVDYRVKSSIYKTMMEHTGLTRKQCKQMVHTTTYRIGRVTIGVNDGLGAKVYGWCGNSKKKALKILRWWNRYISPLKSALESLLERVHGAHRKSCSSPRNYHRYANEVGLILDLNSEVYQREKTHHHQYARNKALLAFMICGVEQAYIREVVSMNPGRVCMLDHDGVVATGALSLPDWRGFTMKVKD